MIIYYKDINWNKISKKIYGIYNIMVIIYRFIRLMSFCIVCLWFYIYL